MPKHCPLLKKHGVDIADAEDFMNGGGRQWILNICLDCPLGERCVFDYPGRVTKADREALEAYYQEKLHQQSKQEASEGTCPTKES